MKTKTLALAAAICLVAPSAAMPAESPVVIQVSDDDECDPGRPCFGPRSTDFAGIVAVLRVYGYVCKEEPAPVMEVIAVIHAAKIAGVDLAADAFQIEVRKRVENMTAIIPLAGTRFACASLQKVIAINHEELQRAAK
jgi:hypothetical protein